MDDEAQPLRSAPFTMEAEEAEAAMKRLLRQRSFLLLLLAFSIAGAANAKGALGTLAGTVTDAQVAKPVSRRYGNDPDPCQMAYILTPRIPTPTAGSSSRGSGQDNMICARVWRAACFWVPD